MAEITTGRLTDILLQTDLREIGTYRQKYLSGLEPMSFSAYYGSVLSEKGISRSRAVANSGLEVHYAYQILSGVRNPKRDKILCLCIGGGFSLRETNRALEKAAVGSLYPKRFRDAVIMLALNRRMSTVWQVNELLSEHNLELLS